MKALLITALFFFGATGWSADNKMVKHDSPQWEMPAAPDFDAITKEIKAAKKNRAPANDVNVSRVENGEFGKFRTRFQNAVKSTTTLHEFLVDIDDNFETLPGGNEVKYFAAQIALLRPMRSAIFRFRPLFETEGRKGIHSMSVTAVRNAAAAMSLFLPGDGAQGTQWRVIFDYVTAPAVNGADKLYATTFDGKPATATAIDTNRQWWKVNDVQAFLANEYAPRLSRAIARMDRIFRTPGNEPIVWDNTMIFPEASFSYKTTKGASDNNPERYHMHGRAEAGVVLSSMWFALHRASMFCAYRQEELFQVAFEMGKLSGFDGWFRDHRLGVTKQDKAAALNKFPNFLVLKDATDSNDGKFEVGKYFMAKALEALRKSIEVNAFIWKRIVKEDRSALARARDNVSTVLNFVVLQTGEHATDMDFEALADLMKGNTRVFSTITGEWADVNLPLLFTNPPTNLKLLLPKTYTQSKDEEYPVTTVDGKTLKYRNYFAGRAESWEPAAWSTVVNGKTVSYVTAHDGKISTALRVFRSTWGGDILSGPLAFAVR